MVVGISKERADKRIIFLMKLDLLLGNVIRFYGGQFKNKKVKELNVTKQPRQKMRIYRLYPVLP